MKNKIKHWWCNPDRWTVIVIYIALTAWFIGLFLLNNSLIAWNDTMHKERASTIDLLERHQHMDGIKLPEGGP